MGIYERASALWDEDSSEDAQLDALQALVDSGDAWRLEGSIGRSAMAAIDAGLVFLPDVDHRDYYGNRIPRRSVLEPGSKGTLEYCRARHPERFVDVADCGHRRRDGYYRALNETTYCGPECFGSALQKLTTRLVRPVGPVYYWRWCRTDSPKGAN